MALIKLALSLAALLAACSPLSATTRADDHRISGPERPIDRVLAALESAPLISERLPDDFESQAARYHAMANELAGIDEPLRASFEPQLAGTIAALHRGVEDARMRALSDARADYRDDTQDFIAFHQLRGEIAALWPDASRQDHIFEEMIRRTGIAIILMRGRYHPFNDRFPPPESVRLKPAPKSR